MEIERTLGYNSKSEEILFHFTRERNILSLILRDFSFKVSYARERIVGGCKKNKFAVPMVSFSNSHPSELGPIIKSYGKFGIGLTKKWAITENLNPVMYVSQESYLTIDFIEGIKHFFKIIENSLDTSGQDQLAFNNVMNMLRYIKNYEGKLKRANGEKISRYVFGKEKEWRFVPSIIREDIRAFVRKDKIRSNCQKMNHNKSVDHIKLPFKIDDIVYIIVENESDIDALSKCLNGSMIHDKLQIDKLLSRICTCDEIINQND